jgi:dienelactone hydrolase
MPKTIPAGIKLPAIIFSNHPFYSGTFYVSMLVEWASHGFMVIVTGATTINGTNNASRDLQKSDIEDAIDFVLRRAGAQNYTQVDSSRIGVAGFRLGGPRAYDFARDSRVTSLAMMNTGPELYNSRTVAEPSKSDIPTAFFLGGVDDIASIKVSIAIHSPCYSNRKH